MKDRKVLNLEKNIEDKEIDLKLRPETFDDYIGQDKIKDNLLVYIKAAKKRKEQLDHVLFYGGPGLGKTTLANIIAKELGVNIKVTSGPAIEKAGDLVSILTNLKEGDVLFIDEIHRLNKTIEEVLYPAMEDFMIDIMIGGEGQSKSIRLKLPRFTLVGATTRVGLLSSPLRDRFGIIFKLEYYSDEEMNKIVTRSAKVLNVKTEKEGIKEIGLRSRGTPRIANRLLKRVRDFADIKYDGIITKKVASESLDELQVDTIGLDNNDRNYLKTLIEKFNGGPVGLDSLAVSLSEDNGTLEEVYEPFLIMKGLITRTSRGRVASKLAYEHLGIKKDFSFLDE